MLSGKIDFQEIIDIKNLLTILSRYPYTNFLKNEMRPFFDAILGQEEVDRHIVVNEKRETTIDFSTVRSMIIRFIHKYYPESLTTIVEKIYSNNVLFNIKEKINEYEGDCFLDDYYFAELQKKTQIIQSFIGKRLYVRGSINIIAAPPGGGKSLFLLTEAMYQAIEKNMRVYLAVIGDMDEYAVFKRARQIYEQKFSYNQENMKKLKKNLTFCIEKQGAISSFTIAKRVENSDYDFVIIDYDDNLVVSQNMLYLDAAQPYLDMDRVKDGRIILFASQGKPASWKENNPLSIGFLASSSRKEHIADSIYVMKPEKKNGNRIYKMIVLKDRHGLNGTGITLATLVIGRGVIDIIPEEE